MDASGSVLAGFCQTGWSVGSRGGAEAGAGVFVETVHNDIVGDVAAGR